MTDAALEKLVQAGTIKAYYYDVVNDEGQVGYRGEFRNTERLHLEFPDGHTLTIGTFCSGSAEDTGLFLETM